MVGGLGHLEQPGDGPGGQALQGDGGDDHHEHQWHQSVGIGVAQPLQLEREQGRNRRGHNTPGGHPAEKSASRQVRLEPMLDSQTLSGPGHDQYGQQDPEKAPAEIGNGIKADTGRQDDKQRREQQNAEGFLELQDLVDRHVLHVGQPMPMMVTVSRPDSWASWLDRA